MTERLATEHLRIEYRDDPDLLALMGEYEALRARVAKLEAVLTAAQQLIRDLGSPQAADRLGSEFGLKDAPNDG